MFLCLAFKVKVHASKRMQQFVKICALLFDKKLSCSVPHFCGLPLICVGSAGIQCCGTFCLMCRNLGLFPLRLRTHRSFTGRQACAAHKRQRTFADYGALSGIVAHLQIQHNCGRACTIEGSAGHTLRRVFRTIVARWQKSWRI